MNEIITYHYTKYACKYYTVPIRLIVIVHDLDKPYIKKKKLQKQKVCDNSEDIRYNLTTAQTLHNSAGRYIVYLTILHENYIFKKKKIIIR